MAGVSAQTIRNYSSEYASLLSPTASRTHGARLYTDEDVRVLCTISDLLKAGVSRHEIAQRIRDVGAPSIIDLTPQPASNQASNEAQTGSKDAQETALVLQMVLNNLQGRIEALERTRTAEARAAIRAAEIRGATLALAAGAFFLWLLYLFG